MSRVLLGIVIGAFAFLAYQRVQHPEAAPSRVVSTDHLEVERAAESPQFRCDGRTHCSQMTSCDEAMYFLQNCPNVKMDGEGDGIPCEKQWCGRR